VRPGARETLAPATPAAGRAALPFPRETLRRAAGVLGSPRAFARPWFSIAGFYGPRRPLLSLKAPRRRSSYPAPCGARTPWPGAGGGRAVGRPPAASSAGRRWGLALALRQPLRAVLRVDSLAAAGIDEMAGRRRYWPGNFGVWRSAGVDTGQFASPGGHRSPTTRRPRSLGLSPAPRAQGRDPRPSRLPQQPRRSLIASTPVMTGHGASWPAPTGPPPPRMPPPARGPHGSAGFGQGGGRPSDRYKSKVSPPLPGTAVRPAERGRSWRPSRGGRPADWTRAPGLRPIPLPGALPVFVTPQICMFWLEPGGVRRARARASFPRRRPRLGPPPPRRPGVARVSMRSQCRYGNQCWFAHGRSELRSTGSSNTPGNSPATNLR